MTEPPFIDSTDLFVMRESMEAMMTQTCTIYRRSVTKTNGDYTDVLTAVGTNIACRLMPGKRVGHERGDDSGNFEDRRFDVEMMLTVPYGTNIARGDKVSVTGENNRYIVHSMRWEDAQWKTCLRVGVKIQVVS